MPGPAGSGRFTCDTFEALLQKIHDLTERFPDTIQARFRIPKGADVRIMLHYKDGGVETSLDLRARTNAEMQDWIERLAEQNLAERPNGGNGLVYHHRVRGFVDEKRTRMEAEREAAETGAAERERQRELASRARKERWFRFLVPTGIALAAVVIAALSWLFPRGGHIQNHAIESQLRELRERVDSLKSRLGTARVSSPAPSSGDSPVTAGSRPATRDKGRPRAGTEPGPP